MAYRRLLALLLCCSAAALAEAGAHPALAEQTTLPIVFTRTVHASHAHAGDKVEAKTSQAVHLAGGEVIPAGTKVSGHVLASSGFVYDKTPYAKQKAAELSIQFDSITWRGSEEPLRVTVRALADALASREAETAWDSAHDRSFPMKTQIGGDVYSLYERKATDANGNAVEYGRGDGVYAHLIANGRCDASNTEVAVGIYSASACGVYGYATVTAAEVGSVERPSVLTLVSTQNSPTIWKNGTALLEVLPGTDGSGQQTQAGR